MIADLFAPKIGTSRRHVNGIFELVVTSKTWICRIGGKQWDGEATSEIQAMQRAFQCAADQIRPMFSVLVKLKNEREI